MTRSFADAVEHLLGIEGGLVDHPADPGGITNYGISLRFARGVTDLNANGHPLLDVDGDGDVDADDIRKLSKEDAAEVYRIYFWGACKCDQMPWPIAFMVFDASVNHGRGPAIEMLQRSVKTEPDGKIGPMTLNAVQRRSNSMRELLNEYGARRGLRYATTKNFDSFGLGWMRRLFGVHCIALAG